MHFNNIIYCMTTLLLMSVLTVHGATFNTLYTTTSSFASYSYPGATDLCSLGFSVNRTTTDPLTFTISKLTISSYSNRLPDNLSSLFGVYGLSINSNITTQWTISLNCPNGIPNVRPTNMRIYSLLSSSYYFTNTQVVPDTPTSIGYSVTMNTKADYTIGFGGLVASTRASIGPYYSFYGPRQFDFSLQTDNLGQTVESMKIVLPNVLPSFNPYESAVAYSSNSIPSNGYTSLYSFSISSYANPNGNPYTNGATLQYSYPSNYNSFKDVNGESIQIIKSTLACFCSNDGTYYTKITSTAAYTSVLCNNVGTNCRYLSIASQAIAGASSSGGGSNSPEDSALEMSEGYYVYTGTIMSKAYYKITVPSGQTLTLKSISLYSSSSGSAYVKLYSDGYSGSYIGDYIYSSSQYDSLSETNYYSYSKTFYVSVEPYSSGGSTYIQFYPSISGTSPNYDTWDYSLPAIIVCSIIYPSFLLIAVIVVISTIKKNSNKNQLV